jgi:flagellar motor switch protein FliG
VTANAQKAATLLQNLPDIEATQLRGQLSEQEQARLLQATAEASLLAADRQQMVLEEFLQLTDRTTMSPPVPVTLPADIPLPEGSPASELPEDIIFKFFHDLSATTLFALLGNESLQTTAVILAHLPTQHAARVLDQFEPQLQADLVHLISTLQPIDLQTLVQIADILQHRLEDLQNQASLLAEL